MRGWRSWVKSWAFAPGPHSGRDDAWGSAAAGAPEIRGDPIHTELQGFCHPPPEPLRTVQRQKHIAAAIERQQLLERQALGEQWPCSSPSRGCGAELLLKSDQLALSSVLDHFFP